MSPDFPLIIADESVDARIIRGLLSHGYAVYSIRAEMPGITDTHVIEIALEKMGFIITEDKDFGDELVYRQVSAIGSMLLRFSDVPIEKRIQLILDTISRHSKNLQNCFCVLTSKKLRIRKYL